MAGAAATRDSLLACGRGRALVVQRVVHGTVGERNGVVVVRTIGVEAFVRLPVDQRSCLAGHKPKRHAASQKGHRVARAC